jgi:hypothetical protein
MPRARLVARRAAVTFNEAEARMAEAALARWAAELGITPAELEERLAT